MKFADGNEKLGSNCIVVSRPVGDTCPTTCQFLGNGCYAEKTEHRFPNAREAGFANLITDKNKIRALILLAIKRGKSIRLHERGDFGINNKLDMKYINDWVWACKSLVKEGVKLPEMWGYTHFYRKTLVKKLSPFIKLYASVHNAEDLSTAKKAGFILFAWADSEQQFGKKKKGGSIDAPKLAIIEGEKFITCPEMRRGRSEVTCTGNNGTIKCDLCVRGLQNVLFLNH